jgi:hypothetical protein
MEAVSQAFVALQNSWLNAQAVTQFGTGILIMLRFGPKCHLMSLVR